MSLCIRCWVSGRVQGVWYRDTTRRQALQLGLSGYARNLADGRVEVLACGDEVARERLKAWLWQGSELAEVSAVECEEAEVAPPSGFITA